jgi:Flp pilus assembly pilin Flp
LQKGRAMELIFFLKRFLIIDEGATAIEYAVLASAIAAVIAAIVFALGLSVLDLFESFHSLYVQIISG